MTASEQRRVFSPKFLYKIWNPKVVRHMWKFEFRLLAWDLFGTLTYVQLSQSDFYIRFWT